MEAKDSAVVSFGEAHFGLADFGDRRLTRRAVMTANQILQHLGGSLPEKLGDEAELDGLYRLANNPKVSHVTMLQAHLAHTRQAMAQWVLRLQLLLQVPRPLFQLGQTLFQFRNAAVAFPAAGAIRPKRRTRHPFHRTNCRPLARGLSAWQTGAGAKQIPPPINPIKRRTFFLTYCL